MTSIRALIVNPDRLSREVLRTLLSVDEAMAVVGEAGSGEEAVEQVLQLEPDVVYGHADARDQRHRGDHAVRLATTL
jgi:DNA-binding NarL/FixJ family response regulator